MMLWLSMRVWVARLLVRNECEGNSETPKLKGQAMFFLHNIWQAKLFVIMVDIFSSEQGNFSHGSVDPVILLYSVSGLW